MKLKITLTKSPIASLQVHKDTVAALGLHKVGQTVIKEDNPCVRGQIFRVKHMVKVEEVAEKLKSAAENKAQQLADKIGYESTAVPVNAIVVHHRFLDREWSPVWKARFTWAVQFLFGGLFSALVVCYFKSSGSLAWPAWSWRAVSRGASGRTS